MRTYELMLIVRPNPDEGVVAKVVEQVTELIQANGGQVSKSDVWGRRKLAYAIDNQSEGTYVLLNLAVAPNAIAELEYNLKLNENLLRYLFVKDPTIDASEAQTAEAATDEAAPVEESEAPEATSDEAASESVAA